jgi:mannose-6-phosphate isomerase-like protein (cupin superfamily)
VPRETVPFLRACRKQQGFAAGYVRQKPRESVGWHTTGENEEALVILYGKGEAKIEGVAAMLVAEHMLAYIPPATRHNVATTGTGLLECVYVVAPTVDHKYYDSDDPIRTLKEQVKEPWVSPVPSLEQR